MRGGEPRSRFMRITFLHHFSTPFAAYQVGKTYDVLDEDAHTLIEANVARAADVFVGLDVSAPDSNPSGETKPAIVETTLPPAESKPAPSETKPAPRPKDQAEKLRQQTGKN